MSDTFCSRPFNEMYLGNGSFSPCCIIKDNPCDSVEDYLKSDWLGTLKNNLKNGIKDSRCNFCWEAERMNAWSNRVTHSVDTSKSIIEEAHITFSNTCNLACQMCNSDLSTSWGVRDYRNGKTRQINRWNTFDNKETKLYFYKQILPNLRWLGISGGEPFQCPDHFEFLKVAPLINPNLNVFYNSNLTNLYFKGNYLPDYFKKFKSVSISASVDGAGAANDYQRLNSSYNTVMRNILEVKKYITYIHATLTTYTVCSLKNLLQWGIDNDVEVKIHFVGEPWLNPNILPTKIKQELSATLYNDFKSNKKVSDELKNNFFKTLFFEPENKDILCKKFKKVTERNNKESPIQFPNYAPMLADWYDSILL